MSAESGSVYTDNIQILDNQVTVTLLMKLTPAVAGPSVPETVATIRMSVSLFKLHVFLAHRYLLGREREGQEHHVAASLLNQNGIGKEDWDHFWNADANP